MDTPLAAIRIDQEEFDAFVAGLVALHGWAGRRVSGVVRSRNVARDDCRCAGMDLTSIATGEGFPITPPLGDGAQVCRLHPGSLAQRGAGLERAPVTRPDLPVLNRFGRGESEGRGFGDLIARVLGGGIPGLTAGLPLSRDAVPARGKTRGDARHAA